MRFIESALRRAGGAADWLIVHRAICLDICHDLDVDRASVWTGLRRGGDLTMAAGFDRRVCQFDSGAVLRSADHPVYVAELIARDFIVVEDAGGDPRVASLRSRYLAPEGVTALLDHCVEDGTGGCLILCCEQTAGGNRRWRPKDREYLAATTQLLRARA